MLMQKQNETSLLSLTLEMEKVVMDLKSVDTEGGFPFNKLF